MSDSRFTDVTLETLGRFLYAAQDGMEAVARWRKYGAIGATPENDLQHSYTASLLAIQIIESLGDMEIDRYAVLRTVVLHDLGEINVQDTHYADKRAAVDIAEIRSFLQQIEGLPTNVKPGVLEGYLLQFVSPRARISIDPGPLPPAAAQKLASLAVSGLREALVFEAIERYGYLIYAYREYRLRGDMAILVQVLRHQHPPLCILAEQLPEFGKYFYTSELKGKVNHLLADLDGQYLEQSKTDMPARVKNKV